MVADRRKEGHRAARLGPELRAEDGAEARTHLDQVAVVVLAATRVSVVPGGQREPRAARGEPRHQVGLPRVGAGRIDLAPIAEDGERIGLGVAGGDLREELGRWVRAEQVDGVPPNTR